MTDDEIRLRIAELKGWQRVSETITTPTRNGQEFTYTAKYWRTPEGEIDGSEPPFWYENPAAALGLIEEAGFVVGPEWTSGADSQRCGWSVYPDWVTSADDTWSIPGNKRALAISDAFCRAICLAWIAWKEAQK